MYKKTLSTCRRWACQCSWLKVMEHQLKQPSLMDFIGSLNWEVEGSGFRHGWIMGSHGARSLAFSFSIFPCWWHSQKDHLYVVVSKATTSSRILSPFITSASGEKVSLMVAW